MMLLLLLLPFFSFLAKNIEWLLVLKIVFVLTIQNETIFLRQDSNKGDDNGESMW